MKSQPMKYGSWSQFPLLIHLNAKAIQTRIRKQDN